MKKNPKALEFLGCEVGHIDNNEFVITAAGNTYEEKFFNKLSPFLSCFLFALLPEGTRYEGLKISALSYEITDLLSYVPEVRGEWMKIGSNNTRGYTPPPAGSGGKLIGHVIHDANSVSPDEMDAKFFSLGGMQVKYTADLVLTKNGLALKQIDPEQTYGNVIVKIENREGRLKYSGINEYFCMALAKACGINVPEVYLAKNEFGGYDYVVERFGLERAPDGKFRRSVVLDAAVFLGKVFMENKYHASSPELFGYMKNLLPEDDFKDFVLSYLYGYMIGNADMHLRNFSVFAYYDEEKDEVSFSLTPIYDMICTKCYARFRSNDLGLGLFTAGVGGSVEESDFLEFLKDYIDCSEIQRLVDKISCAYPAVSSDTLGLIGTEYSSFIEDICDTIEMRIANMYKALNKDFPPRNNSADVDLREF